MTVITDLLTGWERFLRDDDDGTWEWMTTPGESGYGLMPWVSLIDCHCGGHEHNKPHAVADYVWVTPALVTWSSFLNDDGEPRAELCWFERFHDDEVLLAAPMVFITSVLFFEQDDFDANTRLWNMLPPEGGEWYADYDPKRGPSGLAPVCNVVPIDYDYYNTWFYDLDTAFNRYGVETSYAVNCNADHGTYIDGCAEEVCDPYKQVGDKYVYNCLCSIESDRDEALSSNYHDYTSYVVNERAVFDRTWAYAQDRLISGWTTIHNLGKDDTCFRSLEQRLSPFWESNGPATWAPTTGSGC